MAQKDAAAVLVPLVGTERAAELLGGLSPRTLERWRLDGQGPRYAKIGRRCMYRPEDLAAFVEAGLRSGTHEAA